ncbi:MAG: phenylalanine--tRNA ligase subunit alpha [Verrucomicrobiae bacterium]|nr:phenylalanine--tRNA ligase subunit alpha [Verrucomicrobiae bacterium]MCX7721857.1 phenylalanine--tRNA ligase subunit alpha [Verrucomicrobiae bacterium]MDW7979497.1 phenylalanine--tRNA ligase subunit alpha [Verrucomicrobiales bacterium]
MALLDEIEPYKQAALADLKSAQDMAALERAKGQWLGPQGKFTMLMKQLPTLPKEERPVVGKAINAAKAELEAALAECRQALELKASLPKVPTDFTAPGRRKRLGRLHPLTQVIDDIVQSFRKLGFAVADGPEIEDEYHCFDALNTPADHPARDAQDTFYLASGDGANNSGSCCSARTGAWLLRTHTSSVQIRVMEKQPPPVRIIVPGRVYRRDNPDATHNPTFHQIEGLYVDKQVTVGDLKGTVEFVFKQVLGDDVKIRFRPHYFSYTEPSYEIDFANALTRKMGREWLEIAGCGMVHPKVFETVGYDPEVWTGWAFGFGIERIAMLRYGINDIRLFYDNDVRFLRQF